MSYFSDNYVNLRYPIEVDEIPGLRKSQIGAIHAISSHFTIRKESALVNMPTGSGKTVVLMMTPFILNTNRVLVITRNRLVRSQIANEFRNLQKLIEIGALINNEEKPKVKEVKDKIDNIEKWEALREMDIIIATPNTISPQIKGVPKPPEDLFDLVLIDEAHHSPAKTWLGVTKAFKQSKKVLFTATPFRRDKKEINARFIYTYPIKEAVVDKIFGRVNYFPVTITEGEEPDVAIAKKTELIFNQDKVNGFNHYIMVRTDSKMRSNELEEIYRDNTGLRLKLIHSDHSYKRIQESIEQLRKGKLDGVICVDMLGEGFDFPNLKIAAIHSPHRSLEVTLQFIGRFARTNTTDIGDAKFIAIPSEILIETEKLYEEGAVWQDLIVNLSNARITREEKIRETLETFAGPSFTNFKTEDLSLYALNVYHHLKVYQLFEDVDMSQDFEIDENLEIVYKNYSSELSTAICITREVFKPKWIDLEDFNSSEYDLFVIYYNSETKLLFINASRRSNLIYNNIVSNFTSKFKNLPLYKIDKVLLDLENTEFFNIGMRNKVLNSNTENYRIIASKGVENTLDKSIGKLFNRGHIFCKAVSNGEETTIGYSSGSKIWSNTVTQIPDLIDWCKFLASKITDNRTVVIHSPIDNITAGEKLETIPEGIIAATWDPNVFKSPLNVKYIDINGEEVETILSDLDIKIDQYNTDSHKICFKILGENLEIGFKFALNESNFFQDEDNDKEKIKIIYEREEMDIVSYMNEYPVSFFTSNFSRIQGDEIFKYNNEEVSFDINLLETVDWDTNNVDITAECEKPSKGKITIHDFLKSYLYNGQPDIVFYDHGKGEIADFITFTDTINELLISFYHCKGSSGNDPGARVNDVYEVSGQVIKSLIWLYNLRSLLIKIIKREDAQSIFIKGDNQLLDNIIGNAINKTIKFEMILVQPGITKSNFPPKVQLPLAAANDYIKSRRCEKLRVFVSS